MSRRSRARATCSAICCAPSLGCWTVPAASRGCSIRFSASSAEFDRPPRCPAASRRAIVNARRWTNMKTLIRQISAPELRLSMVRCEPLEIVDVRTRGEYEVAHIEGSRLLDRFYHDELLERDRDTPLVFTCHHGIRSQRSEERRVGK